MMRQGKAYRRYVQQWQLDNQAFVLSAGRPYRPISPPIFVQSPKSDDLMAKVFGEPVRDIRFFRFAKLDFHGRPLVIARSGFSKQGGFEIYLDEPALGLALWDALWDAGVEFGVSPGCPNLIERVEAGLLSYGNEMTRENNPLECGFDQYCQLDRSIDFIGRKALQKIAAQGPERKISGIVFDGDSCPSCRHPWPVTVDGILRGFVTTAIWSPRFESNIALAMMDRGYWEAGTAVTVGSGDGLVHNGVTTHLPMQD